MRRALPTIAVTAAGLTWLLHAQGVIDTSAARPQALGSTGTTKAPQDQPTTTTPPTHDSTPAPTTRSTAAAGSVDGPVIQTRYGPVQVQAIVQGGRLTDVKVLQYPFEARRSQLISEQALPLLHDEALSAGSANIDGVSGATYTSSGYERSLQAALDSAGLRA